MATAATQSLRKGQIISIVIASGDTASGALYLSANFSEPVTLFIQAPATLTAANKIQVSWDDSTWADLQSGGANIIVSPASVAVQIATLSAPYVRILSAGAEGAARTFKFVGHAAY